MMRSEDDVVGRHFVGQALVVLAADGYPRAIRSTPARRPFRRNFDIGVVAIWCCLC